MSSSMRLVVGLVAAIVAGAWLGVAYEWYLNDVPQERQSTAAAARGALWFAVAFGLCEVARRLLRRGWLFIVPVTVLVGAIIYDGATLAWSGGLVFVLVRIVAYCFVSVPAMAAVVTLAHAVTKGSRATAGV
jgi:hypothetical protein